MEEAEKQHEDLNKKKIIQNVEGAWFIKVHPFYSIIAAIVFTIGIIAVTYPIAGDKYASELNRNSDTIVELKKDISVLNYQVDTLLSYIKNIPQHKKIETSKYILKLKTDSIKLLKDTILELKRKSIAHKVVPPKEVIVYLKDTGKYRNVSPFKKLFKDGFQDPVSGFTFGALRYRYNYNNYIIDVSVRKPGEEKAFEYPMNAPGASWKGIHQGREFILTLITITEDSTYQVSVQEL